MLLDHGRAGADTLSTHALMRGGVLQLPLGAPGSDRRCRHSPHPGTTFHYTATDIDVAIKPSAGVDALYAPRRTVLDPVLVELQRPPGWTCAAAPVLGCAASRGRVVGVEAATATGDTPHARPARHRRGRSALDDRAARSGATTHRADHTSASVYGYFVAWTPTGTSGPTAREAAAGFIPTNDDLTCVFGGRPPSPYRPWRPCGAGRGRRGGVPDMADRLRSAPLEAPCAPSPASPAVCASRGDPAGRWWGTPDRGRTRSVRTASPTRSATPSCSLGPSSTTLTTSDGRGRGLPRVRADPEPASPCRS